MNIINKETFEIRPITNSKQSTLPLDKWIEIDNSIELYDNTDIENQINNYPQKYINNIIISGDICTSIILYDEATKLIIDTTIENNRINQIDFKSKKYKIESDGLTLLINESYEWMYNWCEAHPYILTNKNFIEPDIIKFEVYLDIISVQFQAILDSNVELFIVSENPYYVEQIL